MADRLSGYRILILETREEAQFSRLLAEQGAEVLQCPMFAISDAPDPAPVEAWIRRAIEKPFDDLVLMTGEGLRRLMKVARRIGADADIVASLAKARKFARGPKPGRALREIGRSEHHSHEEFLGLDIVELLGVQNVLPVMGEERRNRRHDAGAIRAGQGQHILVVGHFGCQTWASVIKI